MAVTQEQIQRYQQLMAAGGIVPGSIPADLLQELQAATSGLQTIQPVGQPIRFTGEQVTGRPPPGEVYLEQNPQSLPVAQAGFGLAGALPWAIAGAGIVIDWMTPGGVIGGNGGSVNGGGSPGAVSNTVPLVGPGVPEPPNSMVKARWESKVYDNKLGYIKLNFYALVDGRIMMYHNTKKYWKIWRPKKSVVISSNPRLSHLKKLARLNKRVEKTGRKLFPKATKTSTQAPSKYLSAVEKKLLNQ